MLATLGLLAYPLTRVLLVPWWNPAPHGEFMAAPSLWSDLHFILSSGALRNSLMLATAAALLATAGGAWLAWLTECTVLPGRPLITGALWLLLILPSYVMTLSWMALLAQLPAGSWLARAAPYVLGRPGIVLALALKNLPLVYLAVAPAWRQAGGAVDDAASVHGLGGRARLRIKLRLLAPALLAGAVLAYAEALSDFGIAATLGAGASIPLVPYAIYTAAGTLPVNFAVAALYSWLLVGSALIAVLLQRRLLANAARFEVRGVPRVRPNAVPGGAWLHTLLAIALLAVALGIPIVSLAQGSLGPAGHRLERYAQLWRGTDALAALEFSVRWALWAATAAVIVGALLAAPLLRPRWQARAADVLLAAAVALPGLVLAVGYVFAYNQPGLPLYGTGLLLGSVYAALQLPLATRLIVGRVAQLDPGLNDAARSLGIGSARRLLALYLPVLGPAVLAAWIAACGRTLLELPASQMLCPPGTQPLAVALTDLAAEFRYGREAALTVTALAAFALLWAVTRLLLGGALPALWRWSLRHGT